VLLSLISIFLVESCKSPVKPEASETIMLHQLEPAYTVPYGIPDIKNITGLLARVRNYLDSATFMAIVNSKSGTEITDFSKPDSNTVLKRGDFPIVSYEWGVTYGGMLLAGEVTGDSLYIKYVRERLNYIAKMEGLYRQIERDFQVTTSPLETVIHPNSLDDAGSMCAAMIKATRTGVCDSLNSMIENYMAYISNEQFRLVDKTFARQGPHPHTLWLDDMYMGIPALAQMGKLTGNSVYYDDAVKQVIQFANRMFIEDKGLFMHGWAEEMETHPAYYWARANGWALMAMTELLDVLPENYKGREKVIQILQAHIQGIAAVQSGSGFWHQLLDRNDSYLETSSTAIYTYCIARAINNGYIDSKVYGSMVLLAWNAITTRINERGQVEGTCVGTGMGFDPAFYYSRPQSSLAAHGYGPVLLAGAEIIRLLKTSSYGVEGGSVKFYEK
jgi:unsaturated rhamnogalacturonyl hydrolase